MNIIYTSNNDIIIMRVKDFWVTELEKYEIIFRCIFSLDNLIFNNKTSNIINIYDKDISLNKPNEIFLILKIYYKDINKKIYFVGNRKKYLYEAIIEGEEKNNNKMYYIPKKEGFYKVKLIIKNQIKDCSNMFCYCDRLVYADLSHFDSKNVTNMSFMFYYCENLRKI